jgi:hypothetical protein
LAKLFTELSAARLTTISNRWPLPQKIPILEILAVTLLGNLVRSKCKLKATEKCQTALKLDEHQFVIGAGKAGEELLKARCSGKLVRVSGGVTDRYLP